MIAGHKESRTTIVLAHQSVEDGFTWPCIAHSSRENAQDDSVRRVVVLQQDFVAAHAYIRGNIVALGIAYQGMQVQAIYGLKGTFLDIFVRAMHGIPGLQSYHPLPAPFGKNLAPLP